MKQILRCVISFSRHAGAYTAEEIIRIMRDKLIRLQKLYIDQFQRLRYLLREERRAYRTQLRHEQEAELASIHAQPKETLAEQAAYDDIRALAHYNRPQGLEAVLQADLMERRNRLSEVINKRNMCSVFEKSTFNVPS